MKAVVVQSVTISPASAGSEETVKCFGQDSKSLDQNRKQAPSKYNTHKSQSEPPCALKIKYAYSHLH